jgi:CBS domain-containing protein
MTALETSVKARDVMVPEPVCVAPSMTLRELMRIFDENEISGAPVIDSAGRVIGVVSKTDLIRRCLQGTGEIAPAYLFEALSEQAGEEEAIEGEAPLCVGDVMTEGPVTVPPELPGEEIARLMVESRIHRVIVVDEDGLPLGIITSLDLLKTYPRSARRR